MTTFVNAFTATFCILVGAVTGAVVGLFACCAAIDLIKYLFKRN